MYSFMTAGTAGILGLITGVFGLKLSKKSDESIFTNDIKKTKSMILVKCNLKIKRLFISKCVLTTFVSFSVLLYVVVLNGYLVEDCDPLNLVPGSKNCTLDHCPCKFDRDSEYKTTLFGTEVKETFVEMINQIFKGEIRASGVFERSDSPQEEWCLRASCPTASKMVELQFSFFDFDNDYDLIHLHDHLSGYDYTYSMKKHPKPGNSWSTGFRLSPYITIKFLTNFDFGSKEYTEGAFALQWSCDFSDLPGPEHPKTRTAGLLCSNQSIFVLLVNATGLILQIIYLVKITSLIQFIRTVSNQNLYFFHAF